MGKVFLVGAGPGDPELLTIKAHCVLQRADIVLYDSLVGPEILKVISSSAQLIDVGKRAGKKLLSQDEINALLVSYAEKNETVVRLKGGDPLLFGRAAEEIRALREAGLDFEVVPGISAAFGAAAAAKVSLTDRLLASNVLFTTFSRAPEAPLLPPMGLSPETSIVVYMPGTNYGEVGRWLVESGLSPETPCLIVSKVTLPDQSSLFTNVAALESLQTLPAPSLLLVGRAFGHSAATNASLNATDRAVLENFSRARLSRTQIS
jgi:uroporphyrin-III C-methyltransferase